MALGQHPASLRRPATAGNSQAEMVEPTASPSAAPATDPSPAPEAVPTVAPGNGAPVALYQGAPSQAGTYAVSRQYGCQSVPPPPTQAGPFPRIVIPSVHINLDLREGDGSAPPDHVWVAWHYPGSANPGTVGNSYIYAHGHGTPENSAPGLFYPIHYMHNCDAVYVYTSSTTAYRYQTVNVNRNWPSRDTRPLNPTGDDRVTLQTCNAYGDNDPKTIVVALRVDLAPPPQPAPPPAGNYSGGGSSSGSGAAPGGSGPQPSPSPSPITCIIKCNSRDEAGQAP